MPAVHRIGLGDSVEGDNAASLLPDRGVVVDTGPPTDAAWDRLRAGIRDRCALDDVEHVLVTHWHADHAGLAPRLAEAADATLSLHDRDAPLVADYAAERERRLRRDRDRLLEWGVPADTVESLVAGDAPSPMPDEFPVEALVDGDSVAGVECVHTPGHTAGHATYVVDDGNAEVVAEGADGSDGTDEASAAAPALFVGDLVLPGTTPNVGGGDTRMTNPLPDYLESLDRVESLAGGGGADEVGSRDGGVVAYPGHGQPLALRARIEELREHHATRTARCLSAAADLAPATPWQVARARFGEMAGIHVKMGAGEAASHLAALEAAGDLTVVDEDPLRYAPV